jgi:hypothetical protein
MGLPRIEDVFSFPTLPLGVIQGVGEESSAEVLTGAEPIVLLPYCTPALRPSIVLFFVCSSFCSIYSQSVCHNVNLSRMLFVVRGIAYTSLLNFIT